ncbi:Pex24p-domain-containing protein [Sporormia fimetaria CBS 119925]|uniref:Pex24p-domain-containing protein n=1 Tax=Sporormia fimetaria CBS 119925 TaxID=1340428 RepID=A0A6A6VH36_9PLEO|nr:Pex24p-domain-containing protein [Sporormia fimetaria CBS 119925]
MSGSEAKQIANRDEPIPVVSVRTPSGHEDPHTPTNQHGSKQYLSPGRLRNKLEALGDNLGKESPSRVSERLFTMLLSQVLPPEDKDHNYTSTTSADKSTTTYTYTERPTFSLPVMSSNFRRFNARIGVVFVFQRKLEKLLTWHQPTQTLSLLFIYTFLCLDPYLLPILPLILLLFFIMVPAFLARHPPPPTHLPTDLYPLSGPPLAAAQTIQPAAELSKDFFRNMRDLQNCMEDFSLAHDTVVSFATPLTNFSNEALSSTLYILLLCTSVLLFIAAHLLPWRYIALVSGYIAIISGHPKLQLLLKEKHTIDTLAHTDTHLRSTLLSLSKADISLQTSQESREVEIFELQYRALHDVDGEFEPFLFSPSPYAPLSPARVAGDRPRGTPFFEDVKPPRGWRWTDKKWTLDLMSREWSGVGEGGFG